MTVRFTSLEAFQKLLASGKALSQVERVYWTLLESRRPMSRRELSQATGIEISAIPRSVGDLIRTGLIVELEAQPCPITGNQVHPVALPGTAAAWIPPDLEDEPPAPPESLDLFGSIARIFERAR